VEGVEGKHNFMESNSIGKKLFAPPLPPLGKEPAKIFFHGERF
jgi:hypothetical protein